MANAEHGSMQDTGARIGHLSSGLQQCYSGWTTRQHHKLQRVQNIAAKIILNRDRRSSVTDCLKQLHWLPVRERIRHKTLTLVHTCLMGNAPMYLQDLPKEHEGGWRHLRSIRNTSTWKFHIPRRKPLQEDHSASWPYMVEWAPKWTPVISKGSSKLTSSEKYTAQHIHNRFSNMLVKCICTVIMVKCSWNLQA